MNISFHGAAQEVTGSCHLLMTKDSNGVEYKLLVDCGMFQGEQLCGSKNLQPFGFDPKEIEAVFVTHPHADHTGRLPKLVKEGFAGKIYMVEPCVGLSKLVLEDAFHIMLEDAEKCGSSILYDENDLNNAFANVESVRYHEPVNVAPGIVVKFHDAGHVLGSSYISFDTEEKRIIFSGDIGNQNVPILPKTEPISHADIVVCESTYGNRIHEAVEERSIKLKAAIERTIKNKSVLMIPAFSIERTQELLYEFDRLLSEHKELQIPIFLDSPMSIKATHLYRSFENYLQFDSPIMNEPDGDFFSFDGLKETLSKDESKKINDVPAPKIIIAGSGMMSGGRIMYHLIRYLPDEKNTLLIIGYQAEGTIGGKIFRGAKSVRIFGGNVQVHAEVQAIGAFSAHADKNMLTQWLHTEDGKAPKKIFLVHGDTDVKEEFAQHLRNELKTEVIIPELYESYSLD